MGDAPEPSAPAPFQFEADLLARLDPELAAATALVIRPDLEEVARARRLTSKLRNNDPTAAAAAAGRIVVEDRLIRKTGDDMPLRVRLYRPSTTAVTQPAVVFMHSGAFVLGDLETEHGRCLHYAVDAGCTVVSVEYRLAPEHPYPAGLEDAYTALQWTSDNAESLGIDPDRIAVAGNSAGGGLAAAVALLARDRGGAAIALQMLICPVLDDRQETVSMTRFDRTPIFDNRNTRQMWTHYLRSVTSTRTPTLAAPAGETNLDGLAEAYILTAEFDPLRDEGLAYGGRLLRRACRWTCGTGAAPTTASTIRSRRPGSPGGRSRTRSST